MRKATKILLIISEVISFVSIIGFIISGFIGILISNNPTELAKILFQIGIVDITPSIAKATYCPIFLGAGIGSLISAVMALTSGILCAVIRRKLTAGSLKNELKAPAIILIITGVLSTLIPIIPAIFVLAMGDSNFGSEAELRARANK